MEYSAKKQLKSFKYALKGIACCVGKEQNLTFHLFATAAVLAGGMFFHISKTEWMVISLCCGCVVAAELFNTAIEGLVDMVSPEWNAHAGRVKDIAAGAVLVLAFTSAVIGIIIFTPYITAIL